MKFKRIAFSLLLMVSAFLPMKNAFAGSGEIFEDYENETCVRKTIYHEYQPIKNCTTGQIIRYEHIRDYEATTSWGRTYCDGGWGWCNNSDAECGPEEVEQNVYKTPVCE